MQHPPPARSSRALAALTAARSATVLAWLRLEHPAALPPAAARAPPAPDAAAAAAALARLLADGTVLADVVSALAPAALPRAAVLRGRPRAAASAPAHVATALARAAAHAGASASPAGAADKPLLHQYRMNMKRVRVALLHLFDGAVGRAGGAARRTLEPVFAAAVEIHPADAPQHALRVAELVIAAALLGPAADEYVWGARRLDPPALRADLVASLRASAAVIGLSPTCHRRVEPVVRQIAPKAPGAADPAAASEPSSVGSPRWALGSASETDETDERGRDHGREHEHEHEHEHEREGVHEHEHEGVHEQEHEGVHEHKHEHEVEAEAEAEAGRAVPSVASASSGLSPAWALGDDDESSAAGVPSAAATSTSDLGWAFGSVSSDGRGAAAGAAGGRTEEREEREGREGREERVSDDQNEEGDHGGEEKRAGETPGLSSSALTATVGSSPPGTSSSTLPVAAAVSASVAAPMVALGLARSRADDVSVAPLEPAAAAAAAGRRLADDPEYGFDGRKVSMITNESGRTPGSSPMPQESPRAGTNALEAALERHPRQQHVLDAQAARQGNERLALQRRDAEATAAAAAAAAADTAAAAEVAAESEAAAAAGEAAGAEEVAPAVAAAQAAHRREQALSFQRREAEEAGAARAARAAAAAAAAAEEGAATQAAAAAGEAAAVEADAAAAAAEAAGRAESAVMAAAAASVTAAAGVHGVKAHERAPPSAHVTPPPFDESPEARMWQQPPPRPRPQAGIFRSDPSVYLEPQWQLQQEQQQRELAENAARMDEVHRARSMFGNIDAQHYAARSARAVAAGDPPNGWCVRRRSEPNIAFPRHRSSPLFHRHHDGPHLRQQHGAGPLPHLWRPSHQPPPPVVSPLYASGSPGGVQRRHSWGISPSARPMMGARDLPYPPYRVGAPGGHPFQPPHGSPVILPLLRGSQHHQVGGGPGAAPLQHPHQFGRPQSGPQGHGGHRQGRLGPLHSAFGSLLTGGGPGGRQADLAAPPASRAGQGGDHRESDGPLTRRVAAAVATTATTETPEGTAGGSGDAAPGADVNMPEDEAVRGGGAGQDCVDGGIVEQAAAQDQAEEREAALGAAADKVAADTGIVEPPSTHAAGSAEGSAVAGGEADALAARRRTDGCRAAACEGDGGSGYAGTALEPRARDGVAVSPSPSGGRGDAAPPLPAAERAPPAAAAPLGQAASESGTVAVADAMTGTPFGDAAGGRAPLGGAEDEAADVSPSAAADAQGVGAEPDDDTRRLLEGGPASPAQHTPAPSTADGMEYDFMSPPPPTAPSPLLHAQHPAAYRTPPSPPAVDELLTPYPTAGAVLPRPVSTMAPSHGLFRKIIDVYRSSESTVAASAAARGPSAASVSVPATISGEAHPPPSPSGRSRRMAVRMDADAQSLTDWGDDTGAPSGKQATATSRHSGRSGSPPPWLASEPEVRSEDWDEVLSKDGAGPKADAARVAVADDDVPPESARTLREETARSTGPRREEQIHINRDRLDWLTQELLAARDVIHRKDVELSLTDRAAAEAQEMLTLEKKDVESVVTAMRQLLEERESELREARVRLASTIQATSHEAEAQERTLALARANSQARMQKLAEEQNRRRAAPAAGGAKSDVSQAGVAGLRSRGGPEDARAGPDTLVGAGASADAGALTAPGLTCAAGAGAAPRLPSSGQKPPVSEPVVPAATAGATTVPGALDDADGIWGDRDGRPVSASSSDLAEMRRMWDDVREDIEVKVLGMLERRDEELAEIRQELAGRDRAVQQLQRAKDDMRQQQAAMQSEAASAKLNDARQAARAGAELSEMRGQVLCVTRFSKKLEDMYTETEHLRAEVAESRAKMAAIASTSGVGSREAKELRDAAERANAEAEKWRSQAAKARAQEVKANQRADEAERLFHSSRGVAAHRPLAEGELDTVDDRSGSDGGMQDEEEGRFRSPNADGDGGDARRRRANARRDLGPSASGASPWVSIRDKVGAIITGTNRPPRHHAAPRGQRRAGGGNGARGDRARTRGGERYGDRRPTHGDAGGEGGAVVNAWGPGSPYSRRPPRHAPDRSASNNSAAEALALHLRSGVGSGTLLSTTTAGGGRGAGGGRQVAVRGGTPYAPFVQGAYRQPAYGYAAYGGREPRVGDFM